MARVVYEVEKDSPHYKNMVEYLEPQNQISIGCNPKHTSIKNRYFKNLKPWY